MLSRGNSPALCKLSKTVVIPKPNNPSGAGFASFSLIWLSPKILKVLMIADLNKSFT
jgi:hypothetical protein